MYLYGTSATCRRTMQVAKAVATKVVLATESSADDKVAANGGGGPRSQEQVDPPMAATLDAACCDNGALNYQTHFWCVCTHAYEADAEVYIYIRNEMRE